jgi:pyruvate formate lyase activating enzyme
MHEALLYDRLADGYVRCAACRRRCTIAPGVRGACGVRLNRDGVLDALVATRVSAAHLDPIEKKPLYHFHPGTMVLSLGTVGCCFTCPGCQNATLSRTAPLDDDPSLHPLTPAEAVAAAMRMGAAGLCWTYNEPAIWPEQTIDGARLAKAHGLYTAVVTNGMATREHLDLLGPYLDAYRVDIKAFSVAGYRAVAGFPAFEEILDSAAYAKGHWGMHVECVTNVTPTINDSDEELAGIAGWIAGTLGIDTPWHVTRFHPCEGFAHLPATPLERLERAVQLGAAAGLRYLYVGNAPTVHQDTCCPACGAAVISRQGFHVLRTALREGCCRQCGTKIAGRW